jgi:hypothetical protein
VLQARIRRLMKAIGEEGHTFHGLRKNSCCYPAETGLNDNEIGAIVDMMVSTVRLYTKWKRATRSLAAAPSASRGGMPCR